MSKLLSTRFSNGAVHLSQLLLRLCFGGFIMTHGWPKLVNFSEYVKKFPDPIGLGQNVALGLTIFAEFFCGAFLVLGLLTRWATVPLIILMLVIIFVIHSADPLGKKEMAYMYLFAFIAILITGPGKYSVDGAIGK